MSASRAGIVEVGDEDVLLRREPKLRPKGLDDLAQRGAEPAGVGVLDAPVLDEQPVAAEAVTLLVPAEMIVGRCPVELAWRREGERESRPNFGAEPFDAAISEQVLQPSVASIHAVAVVALHGDHRPCDLDHMVRGHVSEWLRHSRPRVRLVGGASEATPDQHVESVERAVRQPGGPPARGRWRRHPRSCHPRWQSRS